MTTATALRLRFTFNHYARFVSFGPYPTQDEAKEAFQRRFGYWPTDAITQEEWV